MDLRLVPKQRKNTTFQIRFNLLTFRKQYVCVRTPYMYNIVQTNVYALFIVHFSVRPIFIQRRFVKRLFVHGVFVQSISSNPIRLG